MTNNHKNVVLTRAELETNHLDYLRQIFDTLQPYLTYQVHPVGKRLSFSSTNQSECYFIRKGAVSLYRQPDDILVDIFEAPMLRGIIPVHESSNALYAMRVMVTAEIAILDKEHFYSLLREKDLWEAYAMHLQQLSSFAAEILFKLGAPSVFESVRYQLYELMSKPQAIRESITIENYIRGKTRLSRSAIMNTLSALKLGGYITIERGHLTGVNFIPERY